MRRGTTPAGVEGDRQIARWVRTMFDDVAPRYDLLNHLLSFNADRYWRWRTVRALGPILQDSGSRVVDLCCGSGALTRVLRRRAAGAVYGTDFSHQMLKAAHHEVAALGLSSTVFEADALSLPLADASVDLVTVAFGLRNLTSYRAGLDEMHRVLKPGGTAAILEFSTPPNAIFRALYGFYSWRVIPRVGAAFSRRPDAYRYLPESVRNFPGAERLAEEMTAAGFAGVRFVRMTSGIVALHMGQRR
jgi:demethylmenaquinone methyltransferase/2-methoxy-6-polyprenyl-1,4-benzoquinol methylase